MEYLYLQLDQIFSQESFQTNSAWTAVRRYVAGSSIPIRMLPQIGFCLVRNPILPSPASAAISRVSARSLMTPRHQVRIGLHLKNKKSQGRNR